MTYQATPQQYEDALNVLHINPEVLTTLDEFLRQYRRQALAVKNNPFELKQLNAAKDLLVDLYQNQPASKAIKPAQLIEQIPAAKAMQQLFLIEDKISLLPEPAANKDVVEALSTIQTEMEDAIQKPTPLQKPRLEQIKKSLIDVTEKIKSEGLNNLSSQQAQAYKDLLEEEQAAFYDIVRQFNKPAEPVKPSAVQRKRSPGAAGAMNTTVAALNSDLSDEIAELQKLAKKPEPKPVASKKLSEAELQKAVQERIQEATQRRLLKELQNLQENIKESESQGRQNISDQEEAKYNAIIKQFHDEGLILPTNLSREPSINYPDSSSDERILTQDEINELYRSLGELSQEPDDSKESEKVSAEVDQAIATVQENLNEIINELIHSIAVEEPEERQAMLKNEQEAYKQLLDTFKTIKREIENKKYFEALKNLQEIQKSDLPTKDQDDSDTQLDNDTTPPLTNTPEPENQPTIKPKLTSEQQNQIHTIDTLLEQLPEIDAKKFPKTAELITRLTDTLTTIQDNITKGLRSHSPLGFANLEFMVDFLHQIDIYHRHTDYMAKTLSDPNLQKIENELADINITKFVKDLAFNRITKDTEKQVSNLPIKYKTFTSIENELKPFKTMLTNLQKAYLSRYKINLPSLPGYQDYKKANENIPGQKTESITLLNQILIRYQEKLNNLTSNPLSSSTIESLQKIKLYLASISRQGKTYAEFVDQVNNQIQEIISDPNKKYDFEKF